MTEPVIQVQHISKMFHIGRLRQQHDTLRDSLMAGLKSSTGRLRRRDPAAGGASDDSLWALRDVSFEVQPGEIVGIIGRNGAGKSTLLKILSRITEPTDGQALIHGRVGSLLEVGTGFHPELTGRENIYLNGAILGMRRTEIDRKFDEIVAFAEIEQFLDTPVKRYSSGMYVRLAFAVAAHLEPEILLVDEVLAVGDVEFQRKCLGKMGDVAKTGRTVLFVSHNMAAIEGLCTHGVLLKKGRVTSYGRVKDVIEDYLADQKVPAAGSVGGVLGADPASGVSILEIGPLDRTGAFVPMTRTGDDLHLAVTLQLERAIPRATVTIGLNDIYGTRTTVLHSSIAGFPLALDAGVQTVAVHVPKFQLKSGSYTMDVQVFSGMESVLWAPVLAL